ncbi:hypothetical protein L3556_09235 [Candidatus Synechococcus calcipolaris G9]|uniref:Secreted protein n=1 Tax=Candidatus Synechococcus calcipolaris G9 TaxID=1497997 RepID=A0ABT6EZU7_9SYNE|nr:hypothetical protein [Candidatus Synechococcus calcipolaris]MDG2991107.1 hypothetical protein [Candidatus Synechococcus calcipolaris G9]
MPQFRLALMASPTLLGSLFALFPLVQSARAEVNLPITGPIMEDRACLPDPHNKFRLTCTRLGQETPNPEITAVGDTPNMPPTMLEFSEEESNMAVALFGCDCPLCLNALRQMRGLPPLNQLS